MAIEDNERLATEYRNATRVFHPPEGTRDSLLQCANMLDTYALECFTANEQGQVHFARAVMETAADEIRAFLKNHADLQAQLDRITAPNRQPGPEVK